MATFTRREAARAWPGVTRPARDKHAGAIRSHGGYGTARAQRVAAERDAAVGTPVGFELGGPSEANDSQLDDGPCRRAQSRGVTEGPAPSLALQTPRPTATTPQFGTGRRA